MSIDVDYEFTNAESAMLRERLLDVPVSPYKNYEAFERSISAKIIPWVSSTRFGAFCAERRKYDAFTHPYVRLAGCPFDVEILKLDYEDPVADKRRRKKTFVAEGFLLVYALLMGQHLYAYKNTNNGDVFQDIRPMKSMANSQSQKSLGNLAFHKDDANHYVRPDWFSILGINAPAINIVHTCYASNREILSALPGHVRAELEKCQFATPHDDLTANESHGRIRDTHHHSVISGKDGRDLRFFEGRTTSTTRDGSAAIEELTRVIHAVKVPVTIGSGDFVGAANDACLHNREVVSVRDPSQLRHRWLMKTASVRSLASLTPFLLPGSTRVVDG